MTVLFGPLLILQNMSGVVLINQNKLVKMVLFLFNFQRLLALKIMIEILTLMEDTIVQ